MNNTLTAEKFILDNYEVNYVDPEILKAMIEFAKLHVEAALKKASKNAIVNNYCDEGGIKLNKNSILNAYPVENIK